MKILLLGASGKLGHAVSELATRRGHDVRALVRADTAFAAGHGVELVRGDVLDGDMLQRAIVGVQAVVSCLGQRRAGASPWSRSLSPPDLMTRVAAVLVPVMADAAVARLVVVSAAGVGDSRHALGPFVRWLIAQGRLADAYRDLDAMEAVVRASPLDWLLVRPVTLIDGPARSSAREVDRYGALSRIRRSEVASFLLDEIAPDARYHRTAVMLGC